MLITTMAPHSSTFAWKIPWTEEPGGLQSMGSLESDTTARLQFHFSLSCIGEGNGNPLQCSCLENPRDGGAWWAAVYGVAQGRTRLKRLSSSSSSQATWAHGSRYYSLLWSLKCLLWKMLQVLSYWLELNLRVNVGTIVILTKLTPSMVNMVHQCTYW